MPMPVHGGSRSASTSARRRLAETLRLCKRRSPTCSRAEIKVEAWRRLARSSRRQARSPFRIPARHVDGEATRPSRVSAKVRLHEPTVEATGEVAGSSVAARGRLTYRLGRVLVQRA